LDILKLTWTTTKPSHESLKTALEIVEPHFTQPAICHSEHRIRRESSTRDLDKLVERIIRVFTNLELRLLTHCPATLWCPIGVVAFHDLNPSAIPPLNLIFADPSGFTGGLADEQSDKEYDFR
jgi:hypothetical protein